MKKDIEIPQVTDVGIAIVMEINQTNGTEDWYACILNRKSTDLEMVVIVSQGYNDTHKTSLFRRRVDLLPAGKAAKFELMQTDLFTLDNQFQVTFFEDGRLYEKTYIFDRNTITKSALVDIPELGKGVLAI